MNSHLDPQIDYVLDTNVIIYLLKQDKYYINYINNLNNAKLGISVITWMELIMGTPDTNTISYLKDLLSVINLNTRIGEKTCYYLKLQSSKNLKSPKFMDVIIAATALEYNLPLLTNNPGDFKIFKELKIIVP